MIRPTILLVLAAVRLAAQTSGIQGTVSDTQGAVVPQAVVSLTNQETSAARRTITADTGNFAFVQVAPGPYLLEVQVPGFRSYSQVITLQVNTPLTIKVQLEIGQVTETVNVTAETPPINTQNATIGNPFNETQIRQLPMQTRNIVDLLGMQPGVAPNGEVLGAKRDQNNVILDGVDVNDPQPPSDSNGFRAALPVPLDSVQEFRTTIAGREQIRDAPPADKWLSLPRADRTTSMDLYTNFIATK